MPKFYSLLSFLALVFIISGVGSYFTFPAVQTWYQEINKPSWTPPDWVFGPVWTSLYIMIAVSGWLIWQKIPNKKFSQKLSNPIFLPYWTQLALNFSWSLIFFGLGSFIGGGINIVLLLGAIAININSFRKVSKSAAWLLVPYISWVAYATSLNLGIIALN